MFHKCYSIPLLFYLFLLSVYLPLGCRERENNNPLDSQITLLPPHNLQATLFADTAVQLSWEDGNTYTAIKPIYSVERSTDSLYFKKVKQILNVTTVAVNGEYCKDSTYYFRVRTLLGDNNSNYSNIVSQKLAFSEPTNVTLTTEVDTAVFVNWQYTGAFQAGFEVERKVGNGASTIIDTVGASARSARDTLALIAGQQYTYSARALSKNNQSAYGYSAPLTFTYNISSPTDVILTTEADTAVIINWQCPGTNQTGYEVERQVGGGAFTRIDMVNASVRRVRDTIALIAGQQYTYRLRALSKNNQSVYETSLPVNIIFNAPSYLLVAVYPKYCFFIWQDNSNCETGFDIEQSTDGTTFTVINRVNANRDSVTVVAMYDTTTYYFRVTVKSVYNGAITSRITTSTMFNYLDMVFVQGGTFSMGSTDGDSDEQPVHSVSLNDFYISKYEVTRAFWERVVDWKNQHGGSSLLNDPSYFKGNSLLPVEQVSWMDVTTWIGYLNEMQGTTKYRLPTEAEWEYAARGGIHWVDNYKYSGSNTLDSVGWYRGNSGSITHIRGDKAANQLGIYDMSGNVFEWCSDWYSDSYYQECYDQGTVTNPAGPQNGTYIVLRGGSWYVYLENNCRVADRSYISAVNRDYDFGFRLVQDR